MAKETKIKGGYVHDGKGKQFTTLRDALANDAVCGCGLDCNNGFLVLPNFNPVSGDVDGYYALYIVDGNITVNTVAAAKAAIKSYCNNSAITATSVVLTGCLETDLDIDDTMQLTATVLPSGAIQTGIWESSDEDVATVSITGLVTAVGAGSATITFISTDGGFTADCELTVVD
jgi:hypothetical protein